MAALLRAVARLRSRPTSSSSPASPATRITPRSFRSGPSSFIDAAKKKDAVPDANITLLADPAPTEPKGVVLGRSTKAGVEEAIGKIASRAKANDTIFILLVGHGSFDGRVASFNLSGPDLTAPDYAKLLSRFTTQHVVFVNTASASGAFLQPMAAPGRVIVTATKTGGERNETDFPEYAEDHDVARPHLELVPVVELHGHLPGQTDAGVSRLTRVRAGDRLDVVRPTPPGLEDTSAQREVAQRDDVHVAVCLEGTGLVGFVDVVCFGCGHDSSLIGARATARQGILR